MASFLSNLISPRGSSSDEVKRLLQDMNEVSNRPDSDAFTSHLSKLKGWLVERSTSEVSQQHHISATDVAMSFVQDYPEFFPNMFRQLALTVPFEARKDLAAVFNYLLLNDNSKPPNSSSTLFSSYVDSRIHEIYLMLLDFIRKGETNPDIALLCGSMIRSMLRHPILYQRLLTSPDVYVFPFLEEFVHLPNFDVASDSFTTLQEILRTNTGLVAQLFLENDSVYDSFIQKYNGMLMSTNYLTKRLSIKLLSELLLDRTNFNTMMRYIGDKKNLMISMLLLRDGSGNIQLEAFHIFKIFVANPSKTPEVKKILVDNKMKLIKYLEGFHSELNDNDLRFRDEKSLLIQTLNALE